MLTRQRLVELYQELKDEDVLSVYVDAEQHDPAQREAWRMHLEGEINRLRRGLTEEHPDQVPFFDAAWSLVDEKLKKEGRAALSERGWVAFAAPDRLWYADALPARMPHLVKWQRGVHAAPYIRALKQERPVTVVLVDGRRARILEQVKGDIEEVGQVLADTDVGELVDPGVRKASARASGVRGETSTDHAQRLLEVAAERMRKSVAEMVDQRAGSDGIVVVGGTTESVKKLLALLPGRLDGRVAERQGLHLGMSEPEIREEIRGAAGDLSESAHHALVSSVMDSARAGGKGTLGREHTVKALEEKRVDALLLSRSFILENPGVADVTVGMAFAQGADAEEVSGAAGLALDREGGGIAARLRY